MVDQKLMGDAYHGDFKPVRQVGDPGEYLIEIDHHVGAAFFYAAGDGVNAFLPTGEFLGGGIDEYRPGELALFTRFAVIERRRVERAQAATDLLLEKAWQSAVAVFTYQHFDNLMAVAPQHLRKRDSLGQVAAALALYYK